ncbi:TetR/AcrR family transcriptional regulator [Xylocopilactobacillus apicola]|uniref:Transcriptional regulator n=1 Tax=Xylocopilactobacillus apicola TaxID=2932184 RepID=A0AAU9D8P2_9LACO|nr:TetR/AcrR family transcriptional regulator [Xylocopilactobacillus apicola]BDR58715.1 transcriptional regulator [Xylocopilactobacillus apicola]
MPSDTFINLKLEKKRKITAALLTEFSENSLANSQVARIVSGAEISRGAFYKYFADLQDSYHYCLGLVLQEVHAGMGEKFERLRSVDDYFRFVKNFINSSEDNQYFSFIKWHFTENEAIVGEINNFPAKANLISSSVLKWGATILCHETIRQYLLEPHLKDQLLNYLRISLKKIEG